MAKVLIVDDELSIVESLTEILEWAGHEVVAASNGKEGLAATDGVDLVLVDYMMPVMDGVQMLRALRQAHKGAKVRAILTSAASEGTVRAESGLTGRQPSPWNAFLAKPYQTETLLGLIDSLLAQGRKPRSTPR